MAVLLRDPTGGEYGQVELELQDRILSVYGNRDDGQLFRPDLADQHKVGFFGLDRTSQTDVTEIVDLKEMTEVLQILLQDVATLKRDINFAKHVMQADYESKLQQKSLELYCRINERVTDLEKMHEERVGTVRRAFRQQLSDAIARIAVLYNKNLQRKVRQEKSKHEGDADKLEEKYREMQITLQRNESVIHMLKMQIQQLQNKEPSVVESPSLGSERPSAVTPQTPSSAGLGKALSLESAPTTAVASTRPPSVRDRSTQAAIKPVTKSKETQVEELLQSESPSVNHELEEMREELEAVSKKLEYAEESLQLKDDENNELTTQIDKLNEELTSEKMEKQKLAMEIDTYKNAMEQDKAASQKMQDEMNAGIEKQRQDMMRMMEDKLKQAQQASSQAAEAEARAKQQAEKEKLAQLHEQERRLREELAREKAKLAEALKGDTDINKLRKTEQMLREEVSRLKKEIEKIHRTWEKKFAILQQSLHALKDESYIRQTLQRQAAALHHAAVSYSVDAPLGIRPSKHGSTSKRPLPDIPKFSKGMPATITPGGGMGGGEKDYISYTVSAPSGRGTALFSTDENQIMSETDRDDIPADVVPLPERPTRSTMTIEEEPVLHSKEMGRVIVVPHVPVSGS